jgi:UDP-glucose 4-epimerase
VYGNALELPTAEDTTPRPVSPYGVTKLAGEHLCRLYAESFNVPTVSLRYFTIYGPRQRPDMAFHRFLTAISAAQPIIVNGDGEQTRDFTYVDDVIDGTVAASGAEAVSAGDVFNLGGGHRVTVNHAIEQLQSVVGRPAIVERRPAAPGDARDTFADCARARTVLEFEPHGSLNAGIAAQLEWIRDHEALDP